MKEDNGNQGIGATEFDLSNSQHPGYVNKIHYGNQYVPHPSNRAAKITQADAVMSAVLEAK